MSLEWKIFLQEQVFQHEQYRQYIHQDTDPAFCLSGEKIQHDIGDHTHGDSLRDTVEERHGNDADVAGKRLCNITEVDICYICQHIETNHYQGRSRGKGRNRQKDR